MKFNKHHPYYRKLWWRTKLPWFLIDKGFAAKGEDCEMVNAEHHWYNIDNNHSGCYYCKINREGKPQTYVITIEYEKPHIEICDCCGKETTKLTRFVFENDDAFAVYYASFTKGHDEKMVTAVISMGDWDSDEPKNRVAFPFKIWTNEDNYQIGLTDKEESPWNGINLLGKFLDRNESLKHNWVKDVFHITDHIVAEDKVIAEYLSGN